MIGTRMDAELLERAFSSDRLLSMIIEQKYLLVGKEGVHFATHFSHVSLIPNQDGGDVRTRHIGTRLGQSLWLPRFNPAYLMVSN